MALTRRAISTWCRSRWSINTSTALLFPVPWPDQDDLVRWHQGLSYFFVEGRILWYAVALIVRFLAVNQVMTEMVRIVGFDSDVLCRSAAAEIAKNMGAVMVDDHDHSARLCVVDPRSAPSRRL